MMIGPGIATVKYRGKASPMYAIVLPMSLVKEAKAKDQKLEDRDQIRVWIEKTGIKSDPRPWAFGLGKKKEVPKEKFVKEYKAEFQEDKLPKETKVSSETSDGEFYPTPNSPME